MTEYHRRVPGCEISSHVRRGIVSHSQKDKRQNRELTGEHHTDYDALKDLLTGRVGPNGNLSPRPVTDPYGNSGEEQLTLLEAVKEVFQK